MSDRTLSPAERLHRTRLGGDTGHADAAPRPADSRPAGIAVALGAALALSAGTQVVAWRFRFDPALGPALRLGYGARWALVALAALLAGAGVAVLALRPWRWLALPCLVLGAWCAAASLGPWYEPWALLGWALRWHEAPEARAVLRQGALVVGSIGLAHLAAVVAVSQRPRARETSGAHGTAAWGAGDGLRGAAGVLLGRLNGRLLRFGSDGHVLTVAPTRSGKGVSGVVPNLLDHPGSVVVTDPKGENYAITARRRRALGQQVVALDPFDVAGGDGAFNPLALLDAESADAVDDAAMLADMLVLVEGSQDAAFWTDEARALLAGLILHVAANEPPELRTLARVRTLLTLPPAAFAALLEQMAASPATRGLVARAAARLLQKAEKERSGVVSSAQSHTHFLDSPRMERVLGTSTFDLADLKRGALSVYLVLPPERLDTYARWLRLMIACGVLAMTRTSGAPRERVLFLLDEFPHLGRMAPVERAVALVGGYGARFWIFVQDLAQLERVYGKGANTFLANADVLQAFGTNDLATSETLSKLTGDATVATASENRSAGVSRGRGGSAQRGAAVTRGETGRKLLLPDEVRRLPRDRQLLFVKGAAPILAAKLAYYADPEFAGMADPNPLHVGGVA